MLGIFPKATSQETIPQVATTQNVQFPKRQLPKNVHFLSIPFKTSILFPIHFQFQYPLTNSLSILVSSFQFSNNFSILFPLFHHLFTPPPFPIYLTPSPSINFSIPHFINFCIPLSSIPVSPLSFIYLSALSSISVCPLSSIFVSPLSSISLSPFYQFLYRPSINFCIPPFIHSASPFHPFCIPPSINFCIPPPFQKPVSPPPTFSPFQHLYCVSFLLR